MRSVLRFARLVERRLQVLTQTIKWWNKNCIAMLAMEIDYLCVGSVKDMTGVSCETSIFASSRRRFGRPAWLGSHWVAFG